MMLVVVAALATFAAFPCLGKAKERSAGARDGLSAGLCAAIKKKDAAHATIAAAAVGTALANVQALSQTLRLVPEASEGKVVGYRISAIRPGSLAACLGFKNGDVITAVNGIDITNPDTVMQNYLAVLATGVVRFSLLRKNRPFVLEVVIE
jgi:general secretion pathway protein C